MYEQLGSDAGMQQSVYRELFADHIDEADMRSLRKGTNTGAVIGNDRFREGIEKIIERRATRYPHGGDRKSKQFRKGKDDH